LAHERGRSPDATGVTQEDTSVLSRAPCAATAWTVIQDGIGMNSGLNMIKDNGLVHKLVTWTPGQS